MAGAEPFHAPFLDAPPDFAIGLRPIDEDAWLEGGEADPQVRKDVLFATVRDTVWGEIVGSRAGQEEALATVRAAGVAVDESGDLPPLYRAARVLADDLCLMAPRDGVWRLCALSLSSPTFFTAAGVLGRNLAELHGPVPAFGERFLARVERIFNGLRDGLILERRNWTVVNSDALFTPDPAPIRARIGEIAASQAGERLYIRIERQTLRRLPATGSALFTIRVRLFPLAELRTDPVRLAAFASAWRSAGDAFRGYKKLHLYDPLVEAFLRASGE